MDTLDNTSDNIDPDDILDIVVHPLSSQGQGEAQNGADAGFAPTTPLGITRAAGNDTGNNDRLTAVWTPGSQTQAAESAWGSYTFPTPEAGEEAVEEGPHWFGVMVREVVETVGLAVIIFLIIRVGIQNYRIEGASMEPNFHDGEYLIVNKLAYRLGEYERGDVIVFKYPNDPSKDYIKRVIGLPGDTVEIRGGELYVNNTLINEPYPHMPNVRDEPPTVVEAGHLYVMGDNRPASSDTRSWGQLGQEFVIGQAWLAIYPINQFGLVEHQPIEVNAVMAQGP